MNHKLQTLIDAMEASYPLTQAERKRIAALASEVDGELAAVAFKFEQSEKTNHTMGVLLESNVGELEQKQRVLEGQKRELEIEGSLERVRSKAMGMNKPDDLLGICETLYAELQTLGFGELRNTMINIHNDDKGSFLNYDYSDMAGKTITNIPYDSIPAIANSVNQIRRGHEAFAEFAISGSELNEWREFRKKLGERDEPRLNAMSSLHYYFHSIGTGAIGISTFSAISDDKRELLKRFRNVFLLSYQRYSDISTAEAQAREARIEVALEKVRTRTMAMQRSDELTETSAVLFQQFKELGARAEQISIAIVDEAAETLEVSATYQGSPFQNTLKLGIHDHPLFTRIFDAWKSGVQSDVLELKGKELHEYNRYRSSLSDLKIGSGLESPDDRWIVNLASFSRGVLTFSSGEDVPGETRQLLGRFAGVFDLTYTRFLDLKQAEAQTREAHIEASLEKVRGRALAMHTSKDLAETTAVVYGELRRLGIGSVRCGVVLLSKNTRRAQIYATSTSLDSDALELIGSFEMSGHPSFEDQYRCWLNQENYITTVSGEDLRTRYALLRASISVPYLDREDGEHREHGYFFSFSEGQFYVWTREQYSDEAIALLSRFKTIVELTFRRYLDLQKAEAQARESQIETSLERVRSRTLAMQKSDELAGTAAVLFRQLITLGIAPNRLYIAILKDEVGNAEFWITDEDGSKVSSGFAANLHANGTFRKMFDGWREAKRSLTIDMQGEELQEYFKHLTSLNVPFKGGRSQLRRVQNIAFFSKGFIGIASPDEQPEETTLLLERFAAVFNLTLTRFNDLKLAEAQAGQAQRDLIQLHAEKTRAEEALTELRATQEQLVQQEKLASLGQLTAGIAHEIKNPLNFVNNFSSISVELIDEAIEAMKESSPERRAVEIAQLLSDVKANLTKVVEHGTRADGIVKSMLHHSRGGSGKSEPTDLNALVTEYVNLAFHGMRAGKNPINVSIEFDLDESVGKPLLVGEDFSRVIVNICQNAFDALREKLSKGESGAESHAPKLAIRSRRNGARINLEIEDNGPGIPDSIRDKVLQPFFTTKKGTQGTGLGLSITHDIVKAHRGDLSIRTNENSGTTFIIGLPADPIE